MPTQKKPKPEIENVIPEYLDGDMKKTALDFVAWLRANKMNPVWASANIWKATYKGGTICALQLPISGYSVYKNSWIISPHLNRINEYETEIASEELQDTVLDCIVYCDHASGCSGHGCSPNKFCAGGDTKTILNKELSGVCCAGCNAAFAFTRICDPDLTAVSNIKKLILMEQKAREEKKPSKETADKTDVQIPWPSFDKSILDYLHTRPKIEDAAVKIFEDEKLKNLLDFAAWLHDNKTPPVWVHWCRWRIAPICDVNVGYEEGCWNWNINFNPWIFQEDNISVGERIKEIAWAHIRPCKYCGGCSPGSRLTIFGKEFERACHQSLLFWNPGELEIECAKQLILTKREL